jgi:hypothetical protein
LLISWIIIVFIDHSEVIFYISISFITRINILLGPVNLKTDRSKIAYLFYGQKQKSFRIYWI